MNNKSKLSRINIIRNTLLVCFILFSMIAAHTQPLLSQQVTGNAVPGGVVTLTITIDNSGGAVAVTNINLTDQLSAGLIIATPSNSSTTCTSGTLTAMAGAGSILYMGGSVGAGATCTISVDVTSTSEGMFLSTASLSSSAGNSGTDMTTLTFTAPELDITLDDSISFDPSMDMIANPNDSIQYTLKIENTGDVSAHNLEIDKGSDPNISLDPSTIKATPVAINDIYQLAGSPFNVPMVMGVLTNDADVNDPLPNPPYNANLTVLSVQGGPVGSPQSTENGGTITVQSDGSFVYDSTGVATAIADSFYYKIVDTEGFQDSARVIVFWTRPPEAQNDDLTATINIVNNYAAGTLFADNGNGIDDLGIPEGAIVSFGGGSAGGTVNTNMAGNSVAFAGGMLTVNGDGSLILSNPNMSGNFTFQYKVENTIGSSVATVNLTIIEPPVAQPDSYTFLFSENQNVGAGIGLFANNGSGADALGFPTATLTSFGGGSLGGTVADNASGASVALAGGMLTVNADGSWTLTGQPFTPGNYSFDYRISNLAGTSDATVSFVILDPPVAQPDSLTALVNIVNNYGVGTLYADNGNGVDHLGTPAATLVSFGGGSLGGAVTDNAAGSTVALAGGMLTVNGDGSLILSNPTMNGEYTFIYRIQNSSGFSDATVTVYINEAPIAQRDTATFLFYVDQNINAGAGLFADNGSGADNLGYPTATLTVFGGGSLGGAVTDNAAGASVALAGGTLTVNADGSWSLTGQPFTKDTFSFDYRLESSSGASDATVTLIVLDDPPVAQPDAYTATGNIPINTTTVPGNSLLVNDMGAGITVATVQGIPGNVGMATATTNGGSVIVQTNGEFVYTPLVGYTGSDDFTYSITNSSGISAPVTVTITVSDLIYFMDDAAAVGGDGSLDKPYKTIAEHNGTPPPSNSYLFIKDNGNTYSGNLTLVSGQTVIGEGTTGTLFGAMSLTGITLATLSDNVTYSTTGMSSDRAQIVNPAGNAVTLNSNNMITGLSVGNRMTYAFSDNGASVGMLSLTESEVTGTGGGIKIENGGTLDIDLAGLTTSGGAYGVWLKGTSGTMTVSGGTITNSTTSAITVDGGSVNATFTSSSISQSVNANTVHVLGGHSGIITYSGTVNTTNGNGFQFDNADGQYNFNNAVTLNGGDAGIDILNGSGGSFTFSNTTITNPTGTALHIDNSTASVSYLGGGITQMNEVFAIDITNNASGIMTLNMPVNASTSSANAVNLTGNSNTINIVGGNVDVDLTTTTGIAFNATGGGTVNLSGTDNTISKSGDGNALNINNTNTSSGINFTQVNVTGGTGIAVNILSSTGTKNLGDVDVSRAGGGSGIVADDAGTLNTTEGTIVSGNQNGVDINNTTLGITLTSLSAGGTNGIDLTNILANSAFTITGTTTITSATGNSINMTDLAAGGNYQLGTTNIINRGTTGIFIDNALGTIGFGATTDANGSSSTGYGIRVEDSGAAITFAETNISNTVVGTVGTFNSLTSRPTNDGDGDAIFLKNNTGSFTTNGGTIQDIADNAFDIRNADNTTISGVTIQDGPDGNSWSTANAVIQMYQSNSLSFISSSMSNIGDNTPIPTGGVNVHDVGMRIYDCEGDLIITSSVFNTATGYVQANASTGSQDRAVELDNDTGTDMNVTVTGSNFTNFDFQGLNLRHIGGSLDVEISGANTFTNINGAAVNTGPANAAASGNTHGLLVDNNTFNKTGIAVEVFSGRGGTIGTHATISNNVVMGGTYSDAFRLVGFSNGVPGNNAIFRGLFMSNSVSDVGGLGSSGGSAFFISAEDGADVEVKVSGNTPVTGLANGNFPEALRTQNQRGGKLDVIVENNSFSNFQDNFFGAVFIGNDNNSATRTTVKFDENIYQNVIGAFGYSHGFDRTMPSIMEVEGFTGTTDAQMATHLNSVESEMPAGTLVSAFYGDPSTNGTATVTAPMSLPLTP